MKRALRLDKVTLAALEAVLKLYAKPEKVAETIPSLKLLSRTNDEIEQTALKLKSSIEKTLVELNVSVQPCQSQIGSGALPTRTLESYAVVIEGNANYSATRLAESFRRMSVPVIGRVSQDSFWLDCRGLDDLDELTALIHSGLSA